MATRAWSDTAPAAGDKVGEGDDRMRDDRQNARERLVRGGHYMADTGYLVAGDDTDHEGKHVRGIGAGPDIYRASDKTTKLVAYPDDTTVDMSNATSGVLGPNITSGTNPGHLHTGTIAIRVAGLLASGRIKVAVRAPRALTFVRVWPVVFTAPTGASLVLNAYKIVAPTATTDRNSGGTALWLIAGNKPTILAGQFSGTTTTFDNATTANAGDEIVFEIEAGAWTAVSDLTINFEVDKA